MPRDAGVHAAAPVAYCRPAARQGARSGRRREARGAHRGLHRPAVPTAGHVAHLSSILERLKQGARMHEIARLTTDIAPERDQSDNEGEPREQERHGGHIDDHVVRNDLIEGARAGVHAADNIRPLYDEHTHRHRDGQHQRDERDPLGVTLEQALEHAGPGIVAVGLGAQLGERLQDVDGELVRRRVLARVIAALTAMAQVGEIRHVPVRERQPLVHRRKDSAIPLAVPARVADLHDAFGFG